MNDRLLTGVSTAGGISCVAIGAVHAIGGVRVVPGAASSSATVDSQERFFGPIFAAWGLLLLRAGRQPADLATLDLLSASMIAGGAARVLSMRDRGRPHPFYVAMTVIEFVAPAGVLALTRRARWHSPEPTPVDCDRRGASDRG